MCTNHAIFSDGTATEFPVLPVYNCKSCGKSFKSFGKIFNVLGVAAIEENNLCPTCWESECPWLLAAFLCLQHDILGGNFETVLLAIQYRQNTDMY